MDDELDEPSGSDHRLEYEAWTSESAVASDLLGHRVLMILEAFVGAEEALAVGERELAYRAVRGVLYPRERF